ncbi:MAG: hypothetical protein OEV64_11570 [Desulfobulbaceae bacterium]|nr:hypothetical protein [Desulfobulbaceae bacterium]
MKNIFDYIITATFLTFIILPIFFTTNERQSSTEKRTLTEFPKINRKIDDLKVFPVMFEQFYNDHFGFRDPLVYCYSILSYYFGVSPNSSVIAGNDDWFFLSRLGENNVIENYRNSKLLSDAELERWKQNLETKYFWLKKKGIKYFFVIAPDKHTIYGEYMPSRFIKVRAISRQDQLLEHLKSSEVPVVDLRPALQEKKRLAQLYFKTDTHWNAIGASIAQFTIAQHLHFYFPDIKPINYAFEDFIWKKRKGGDLAEMMNLKNALTEINPVLREKIPISKSWDIDPKPYGIKNKLMPLFATTCKEAPKRRALVFRDSFFISLQPYMSRYFSYSTYSWSIIDFNTLEKFIQDFPCDIVIEEYVERNLYYLRSLPDKESSFHKAYLEAAR